MAAAFQKFEIVNGLTKAAKKINPRIEISLESKQDEIGLYGKCFYTEDNETPWFVRVAPPAV